MHNKNLWIKDKWDERKGRSISIKIKNKTYSCKSKYQNIDVYDTECFGRMLMLDNVIMLTEFDEFAYHEMIAHVPLNTHPDAKDVLIIGGGDGGTAREVLKHRVENVDMCEIDEEVVEVSKEYLPFTSSSFDDPRLKLYFEDGANFVNKRKIEYDLIIIDSSDPIGPAEVLFKEKFYEDLSKALKNEGIAVSQSESMFYDKHTIKELFSFNKKIFPIVKYYYTLVPTYPSGTIGFSFCSKKYNPLVDFNSNSIQGLKYYNKDIHKASFKVPEFISRTIKEK